MSCPFCEVPRDRILDERASCMAILDLFPVTPGHTLIIPRRHVPSFRDLTADEWAEIHRLARATMDRIGRDDPTVSGFNVGINDGADAGQTIPHAHVHVIPRRRGDVDNPRGGVRWIFPDKADYMET